MGCWVFCIDRLPTTFCTCDVGVNVCIHVWTNKRFRNIFGKSFSHAAFYIFIIEMQIVIRLHSLVSKGAFASTCPCRLGTEPAGFLCTWRKKQKYMEVLG